MIMEVKLAVLVYLVYRVKGGSLDLFYSLLDCNNCKHVICVINIVSLHLEAESFCYAE